MTFGTLRTAAVAHSRTQLVVALSATVVVVVAVLLIAGCTPQPPGREPDMSLARVTGSTQSGDEWSLMVEVPDGEHARLFGTKAEYQGYDKAAVRVNSKTTLVKSSASELVGATIQEVLAATHLSVWFDGPVAESYPVQATAGYIQISD